MLRVPNYLTVTRGLDRRAYVLEWSCFYNKHLSTLDGPAQGSLIIASFIARLRKWEKLYWRAPLGTQQSSLPRTQPPFHSAKICRTKDCRGYPILTKLQWQTASYLQRHLKDKGIDYESHMVLLTLAPSTHNLRIYISIPFCRQVKFSFH